MSRISINGVSIDPLHHAPELEALSLSSVDASKSDYILIQVDGPVTAAQRAELAQKGCELLEFVPEDTYIARFPGDNLADIRSLPFVKWANSYLKGFKINPSLASIDVPSNTVQTLAKEGAFEHLHGARRAVTIVLHKGENTPAVYDAIARAAGVDPQALVRSGRRIKLSISSRRLKDIADIDAVRHVEPQPKNTLFNDVAGKIIQFAAAHQGIGQVAALDGHDQVVAVCDTGFDKGSTANTHPAFVGRVLQLYPLGRATASDPDGHGTHVSGSILGNQIVAGYGPIMGAAPAAKLVLQSVMDGTGSLSGIPDDLNDLFRVPYGANGARVHSNSWGNSDPDAHRAYDSEAEQVDEFVHAHRDMVICFAAGNDGIDADANGTIDDGSVSPPGTAKNCITVGASESQRPHSPTYGQLRPQFFPVDPLNHDASADNPEGLAAFSSRGTTIDGRIKPDVVAPGTSILSTLSRDAAANTTFGANPPAGYMYDTGTSMATPLVAGSAALIRQHLIRDRGLANPSAALIKALLVNGADPLKGQYVPPEVGTIPNPEQGFGRVNIASCVDPALELHDEAIALGDVGASAAFQTTVGPAGSLKVTLVWTDPPGLSLQNDLDLVVKVGGGEHHGNTAPGAVGFDRTNNVEQVWLSGLQPGAAVSIEVRAFRIALESQTFALVIRK